MRGSGRPGLRAAHGAGILGLVGCLILVAVLVGIRPDPITDFRRSYRDVGIGEQGQLRAFDITVTGVSRVAAVPLTEGAYVSDQTLIVVELEGSATTARAHFSELTLMTADGHSYDPRARNFRSQPCRSLSRDSRAREVSSSRCLRIASRGRIWSSIRTRPNSTRTTSPFASSWAWTNPPQWRR